MVRHALRVPACSYSVQEGRQLPLGWSTVTWKRIESVRRDKWVGAALQVVPGCKLERYCTYCHQIELNTNWGGYISRILVRLRPLLPVADNPFHLTPFIDSVLDIDKLFSTLVMVLDNKDNYCVICTAINYSVLTIIELLKYVSIRIVDVAIHRANQLFSLMLVFTKNVNNIFHRKISCCC